MKKNISPHPRQNLFGKISDKKLFWIIALIAAVCYFALLNLRALWDPGESRYALISAEMLKNHNWIVPTLNRVEYFEIPPLGYWLNAISMWIFGINELGARFMTASSAILTVIGTYFFTRRTLGRQSAVIASAVLIGSTGFFAYSQICGAGMLFNCLLCWGLWFLFADFEKGKRRAIPVHIGYLMLGLACLAKGPDAFVIALVIIASYLTLTKQWHRYYRLYPFTGILLALIVSVPWFIAINIKEPQLFKYFLISEYSNMFLNATPRIRGQFWYFIAIITAAFFPWIVMFPNAVVKIWKEKVNLKPHIKKTFIYLFVWIAVCFAAFLVFGSKRLSYILPLLPPLAIITGYYLSRLWHNRQILLKKTLLALALINTISITAFSITASEKDIVYYHLTAALITLSVITVAFLVFTVIIYKKTNAKNLFLFIFCFSLIFDISLYLQSDKLSSFYSRKKMARIINSQYKSGKKIFSYRLNFAQSLSNTGFYAGKRIYIVGEKGKIGQRIKICYP